MRVIGALHARAQAVSIAENIAEDRPTAARRWVRDLFAKAAAIRHQPRRGRRIPEVNRDEIREILFGAYRVVYRLDSKRIVVLSIRRGRRQWDPSEIEPEER